MAPASDLQLSPLDAMEEQLNALSSGDIESFAASTAPKRTSTEAELDDDPSRTPTPPPSDANSVDWSLVPSTRRTPALNLVQVAKSIAASKKRKTDHTNELVAFAELSAAECEVATYDLLIELRNSVRHQYAENDTWSMSKNLKDDVRSYAQALILAPAIPCYMPDGASIQNLLVSKGVYPETWSSFGSRLVTIRQYAGTCATDMRADIKNAIKNSLKSGSCLSALCKDIVTNTQVKVTAAFRHRVAWLRFIYVNHPERRSGKAFWEFVDEQLRALRKKMNNDAAKLAFAMTFYTKADEDLYKTGDDQSYELVDDKDIPQLQAAANAAAKALVPAVPKAA